MNIPQIHGNALLSRDLLEHLMPHGTEYWCCSVGSSGVWKENGDLLLRRAAALASPSNLSPPPAVAQQAKDDVGLDPGSGSRIAPPERLIQLG